MSTRSEIQFCGGCQLLPSCFYWGGWFKARLLGSAIVKSCVDAKRLVVRHRLIARPAWQTTEATPEVIEALKSRMAATMAQTPRA
jgi:hypothetical protein